MVINDGHGACIFKSFLTLFVTTQLSLECHTHLSSYHYSKNSLLIRSEIAKTQQKGEFNLTIQLGTVEGAQNTLIYFERL